MLSKTTKLKTKPMELQCIRLLDRNHAEKENWKVTSGNESFKNINKISNNWGTRKKSNRLFFLNGFE